MSFLLPCTIFSAITLIVTVGMMIYLRDFLKYFQETTNQLDIVVQVGSLLFGAVCLVFHGKMIRSNGYFVFATPNAYLLHMLICLLLFTAFVISSMFAYAWKNDRILNLTLFFVFDSLQCFFMALSLFSQKSSYDAFVYSTMRLNTNNGNPIDSRTASRLYRLKFGRNTKMNQNELERLQTYLLPSEKDRCSRTDLVNDLNSGEGYSYCAAALAV
ncbi:hypothetical protein M3Y98_00584800 [Aphelenchoides besseyi]|nr:hypothetical protein M3Y98_00584800 [Aphelenchoides besseyi]KAI6193916.1 hypothetical protein M3Y96_01069400 [Aphelenchoides besseyi]